MQKVFLKYSDLCLLNRYEPVSTPHKKTQEMEKENETQMQASTSYKVSTYGIDNNMCNNSESFHLPP